MSSNPLYIFGPCAAESRAQVHQTARSLIEVCGGTPFIFRAGAWKPRTSPYTFQGVGEEGLVWLREVKESYGIPVATEVATPSHAESALSAGIDYLWIGARTSANPIAVQAIADACHAAKGVFIKNPVNEDARLWLGNIERMEHTGVSVTAVHRGCNHHPCWRMAHTVRSERPDIPLLIDPSHMGGKADEVKPLLEKAADLGYDGAMIEVHCTPGQALSDAQQQIAPSVLGDCLLSFTSRLRLVFDSSSCLEADSPLELSWLRAEIDELDACLWETIAERMNVSKRIGTWKKQQGVAPLQPQRYQQIVERLRQTNSELQKRGLGLDEKFMRKLWEMIHEESLRQQE